MYQNPWNHIAELAGLCAQIADTVSTVYPKAQLVELGCKVTEIMLLHPNFDPPLALTAHQVPYWR